MNSYFKICEVVWSYAWAISSSLNSFFSHRAIAENVKKVS